MRGPGGGTRGGQLGPAGAIPEAESGIDVQEEISVPDSGKTQEDKPVQVRSLFPETWLWDIVTVGLVTVTESQRGVFVLSCASSYCRFQ